MAEHFKVEAGLGLAVALAAVVVLAGCSSADQRSAPDFGGESAAPSGKTIAIEEWGVTFVLPDSIDPTDITLMHNEAEPGESEWVGVASTILADELRHDVCSGTSLEAGEFLSIYQSDQPKDETFQVGDHHYRVHGSLGDERCYDEEIAAIYLADAVKETAQETLAERG